MGNIDRRHCWAPQRTQKTATGMSSGTYTVARLLEDCANSPQHSKADKEMFQSVWGGMMAWMASNWMMSKGINVSPLGKFVFHVEVLKSEQKRREQTEMKRMLAKQVVERQKKREEERREKLVPYDLTYVLPLERDRDFFQEYAEKQGMKRALFKQMDEKKAIKQRELDRERAMDLESKEALAVSLAKEHALNSYQQMSAGQMLRDNWSKQIRLKEIENGIDGDCYCPEPQGKRGA